MGWEASLTFDLAGGKEVGKLTYDSGGRKASSSSELPFSSMYCMFGGWKEVWDITQLTNSKQQ